MARGTCLIWSSCLASGRRRQGRCWAMADKDKDRERDKAVNRRAFHDYFVDEKYEAGMVLTGTEVKSIREGRCNLRDGFVRIDGNEAWLENEAVAQVAPARSEEHTSELQSHSDLVCR